MNDLDELMELTPSHASVLLVDPVELADRAGRSARVARRRANGWVAGLSASGVTVAVAIGALFIQPMWGMPAASPSSAARPYPSSTPMSSFVPMNAGDGPADYSAARVAYGKLSGQSAPDRLCVPSRDLTTCTVTLPVTGLTWDQVSWALPGSSRSADAVVWGYFDGTTLHATTVTRQEDTSISYSSPVPTPAAPTVPLISCDRTLEGTLMQLQPGLKAEALAAYWMDPDHSRLMVATTGDLDAAAVTVRKYWSGNACIGKVPPTGPLSELLAAAERLRGAKIAGVISASAADYPGGVLEVDVVANVPGLRERVVEVVGTSVPLTIVPALATTS